MRLKKNKIYKGKVIAFRVTEKEFNLIKIRANLYTDGNVSEWITQAGLKFKPKRADIEE